jgi:hypothetical protein
LHCKPHTTLAISLKQRKNGRCIPTLYQSRDKKRSETVHKVASLPSLVHRSSALFRIEHRLPIFDNAVPKFDNTPARALTKITAQFRKTRCDAAGTPTFWRLQ